jgi:hypothetical protein
VALGDFKALISPLLEVAVIKLALRDGVGTGDTLALRGVPGPQAAAHWQFWVPTVFVGQRVPGRVQVAGAANVWQVLEVAASITIRVVVVHERRGVKRLVNITHIVDDQSEGEGTSISLLRE